MLGTTFQKIPEGREGLGKEIKGVAASFEAFDEFPEEVLHEGFVFDEVGDILVFGGKHFRNESLSYSIRKIILYLLLNNKK